MKLHPVLTSLVILFISVTLYSQTTPPNKWINPRPFGQGAAWVKVWDENLVYAAAQNGSFLKSTDGGMTWSINTFSGIPSYNLNSSDLYCGYFVNQNVGFVSGNYGITKTTDGGMTFNPVAGNFPATATARKLFFFDENKGYVVGTSGLRMSETSDGGATWTMNAVLPSTTYYDLFVHSPKRLVVGGNTSASANIRVTTDAGLTWTASAAGTGVIYSLEFTDTLTGYAGSSTGRAYKTTDGGLTWTQLTIPAPSTATFYDIAAIGNKVYFLDQVNTLYATSDGGATFTSLVYKPANLDIAAVIRTVGGVGSRLVVMGDYGHVFTSINEGVSWQTPTVYVKTNFVQGIAAFPNGRIVGVGPSDGTTNPSRGFVHGMSSSNFGETWSYFSLWSSSADIRSLHMFNPENGFACGSGGLIYKTTNAGVTWDSVYQTNIYALSKITFYDSLYGVVCGNNGNVWKTTDGGTSWVNIGTTGSTASLTAVAMADRNTIIVGSSTINGVFRSTDGGTTWATGSAGGTVPYGISNAIMTSPATGYLIGTAGLINTSGFVYRTDDGGVTWNSWNFPYTSNRLYMIEARNDSDIVLTGAEGGIFRTTDLGATWKSYNLAMRVGLNGQVLGLDLINQDTVIVSAAGGYILKFALEPLLIPVELTGFTASVTPGGVKLNWLTATETNNKGFEVLRKTVGSDEWVVVGYLEGKGTTTEQNSYTFTDNSVSSGKYHYRLKQIDFDGSSFVYEMSSEVSFDLLYDFELGQNYPNPFNPETKITFSLPSPENVILKVYDVTGKEVKTLVSRNMEAGKHTVTLNTEGLSSGVYFYQMTAGSFTSVKKLSVLK